MTTTYTRTAHRAHKRTGKRKKAQQASIAESVAILAACAFAALIPFAGITFLMVKWITTVD